MKLPSPIVLTVLLLIVGVKLAEQPLLKAILGGALITLLVVTAGRLTIKRAAFSHLAARIPVGILIWCALALITGIAFGGILATRPRLHTTYLPDEFATAPDIDSQRGFYPTQVDTAGNRYAWTQERATLVFDFLVHKPITITFVVRSAAVAGGVDSPIDVTVNGQAAGQLRPDPQNMSFQTFNLRLVPYNWGGERTEVRLLPASFRPSGGGDNRILGTMIQSVSVDKAETWSSVGQRLWLLWALPVLAFIALGCAWVNRRRHIPLAGYGVFAASIVGFICAGVYCALVLRVGVIAPDTYFVWVLGSAWFMVAFLALAALIPLGPEGYGLREWARDQAADYHIRDFIKDRISPLLRSAEDGSAPTRRMILRDLALVFVVALGIRMLWIVATPPWESPDEPAHFTYIQHLVEQREIPKPHIINRPVQSNEETVSRENTLNTKITSNGAAGGYQLPYLPIDYNYADARAYQAQGEDRWSAAGGSATSYSPLYYLFGSVPYVLFIKAPIIARMFAVRFSSSIIGALGCVFAYLLAFELRGTRRWGWALGLAMTLMPMYAFISAMVNNDVAMDTCATALIWLTVRLYMRERLSLRLALALGIVSGLTMLSKPTVLPIAAVSGIIVCVKALSQWRALRERAQETAMAFGVYVASGIAVYSPWMLFRLRYYHDLGVATIPFAPLFQFLTGSAHISAQSPSPVMVAVTKTKLSLGDYLMYKWGAGGTIITGSSSARSGAISAGSMRRCRIAGTH